MQGHCVVRNGADGKLQNLIAAEFEAMYAVSHPGRARLHGFGIFGGSNGYWRTSTLRLTRLRSFMLTEDIDSSMRVIAAGGRIVSDPGLLSTELAPGSWSALWGQRLRWAQGWSQVALRYLWDGLRNPQLTRRQKAGLAYLLGWREIYPWISLQTFPILAFWILRGSPPVSWFVPVFVCHDPVRVQRGRDPGLERVAAVGAGAAQARALVRPLRPRVVALLHRVQERRDADRAPQGGHAREAVEGHAALEPARLAGQARPLTRRPAV